MKNKFIISVLLIMLTAVQGHTLSYEQYNRIHRKAVHTYRTLWRSPIKWNTLGSSARKRRIFYKTFGRGKNAVIIVGGIHGDEPASALSVVKLGRYLHENRKSIKNKVILIPFLNPDGIIAGTRVNGRRVDINRNYPSSSWKKEHTKIYNYPGRKPGSEPETKNMIKAIKRYSPVLIVQMHQPFNTIYPDKRVPKELSRTMSLISGIPLSDDIGYDTPGSLGSYAAMETIKIPVITYELGGIDRVPNYRKITGSLVKAVHFFDDK